MVFSWENREGRKKESRLEEERTIRLGSGAIAPTEERRHDACGREKSGRFLSLK